MRVLWYDYETYYDLDYSLSKMTTESYIRDPRFEVIGVAAAVDDGPSSWLTPEQWGWFVSQVDWSTTATANHHAHFDGFITAHHYGKRPALYLDTLSMSRAIHGAAGGNSLAALGEKLGIGTKGFEVEQAKGKHRADFTAQEYAAYGVYSCNDNDMARRAFKVMAPRFPRTAFTDIDILVRMFTDPVLVLDEGRLGAYLAHELKRRDEILAAVGLTREDLLSPDKFAAALVNVGVEPPLKPSPTDPNKLIYSFAKTDPEFQNLLESQDDDVRLLAEARLSVRSTTNVSRTTRLLAMGAGGRACPVYLKYYGAHTGRPSGGDKTNWTNFERTNKKNPNKGVIRKSICAPPGHKLVVADFAQIQARLTVWLAGQDDVTRQFAAGEDVYSLFASEAYGRTIDRKKNPDDEIPGQVGKACVLGLGFEMGWFKFAGEMLKGANGGPKVQFKRDDLDKLSIDPSRFLSNPNNIARVREMPSQLSEPDRLIHCAIANYFVETYRRKNRMVTQLWRLCERMVGEIFSGHYGPCFYLGCLTRSPEGFVLPGGMTLRYPHIEVKDGSISYLSGKNQRTGLYGGKITENIIQALEVVIANRAMRSIRDEYLIPRTAGKGKIALFSYDEIGVCVPEQYAGECLNTMLDIMKRPLEWAPGLPLAVEGDIGDTYGEVK